jgi:hypothetical protein
MINRALFAVVVFLWAFGTSAQLFNPISAPPFSGVFGPPGTPPIPFFNQTAAVNYNYGGQRVGYNVPSPACVGVTCVAGASTYRADAVNFKASTFGSGFNYQLAFGLSPNSWNYTISITQPGPYNITLWTGSASAGGSWNVLIDNVVVGNVVTPNTGDYSLLAASSSAVLNPQPALGTHILTLAWASGDGTGASGDLVAWRGGQATTGATACDHGPSYTGPIPAGATAAGFTHCLLNLDFTQPFFTTRSNWLDCAGATTPVLWNVGYGGVAAVPCSEIAIITDGGVQVLNLDWSCCGVGTDNDGSTTTVRGANARENSSVTANANGEGSCTTGAGVCIPPAVYEEIVSRLTAGTTTSCPAGQACEFFNWFTFVNGSTNPFFEPDLVEEYNDGSAHGCTQLGWNGATGGAACPPFYHTAPGFSQTSYWTMGNRTTNNLNNAYSRCSYADSGNAIASSSRTLLGCGSTSVASPPAALTTTLTALTVCNGTCNDTLGRSNNPTASRDSYIQRATYWTCPPGNTCNTPLYGAP